MEDIVIELAAIRRGCTRRAIARVVPLLFMLSACAASTCPEGSVSVDGNCVSEAACEDGQVLADGGCSSSGVGSDGGTDSVDDREDASQAADDAGPCESLDCGEHGECTSDGSDAECECDDGFTGAACDACAAGLALDEAGDCVPACDGPDAPNCGEHGACVALEQSVACECEHPYAGTLCADCAAGFALDDANVCVPDCGECGAHEYCDEALMTPACTCVLGYRDDGDGCEWVGSDAGAGLVDEEINDPTAWHTRHVEIDNGRASFVNATVDGKCELGELSQTIQMPKLEDSDPLVLELVVATTCASNDPAQCPALQLEIGESVTRVPVPGGAIGPRTISVCLGASAFGDDVPLRVRPNLASETSPALPFAFDCAADEWPTVEALRIVASTEAECPVEQGLLNTAFGDASGWRLTGASVSDDALTLEAGDMASTRLVVPAASVLPGAALRVERRSGGGLIDVAIGGVTWSRAAWPEYIGGGYVALLCLPDWTYGAGHDLRLTAGGGTVVLESISIELDARCGDGAFDSSFERDFDQSVLLGTGSWHDYQSLYVANVNGDAHTGMAFVRSSVASTPLRALMLTPRSVAEDRGLALTFWLRPNESGTTYTLGVAPWEPSPTAPTGTSSRWASSVLCLDRAWLGQLVPVALVVNAFGSSLDIDDVAVVETNSCPF